MPTTSIRPASPWRPTWVFPAATDGTRRFPLVVDTVGSPSSMTVALDRVEVGGTLLCLGLDSRPLEFSAQTLVRRQLTLRGSLTYDHPGDFAAAIAMIAEGRLARADRH